MQSIPNIRWQGEANGHLVLLDQTRLPTETVYLECRTVEDVWQAIRQLVRSRSAGDWRGGGVRRMRRRAKWAKCR